MIHIIDNNFMSITSLISLIFLNYFIRKINKLKQHTLQLSKTLTSKSNEVEKFKKIAFKSISTLSNLRDNDTGTHLTRTQLYVKILAYELKKSKKFTKKLTENYIKILYNSAPLHDIGKIGIPDSILLKADKLTDKEYEQIKQHVVIGKNIMENIFKEINNDAFLKHSTELIIYHHERWDGKGYPYGLQGNKIPLSARIMSLADVYDALISKRVYKEPLSHEVAVDIIKSGSGTQFDPEIVKCFLEIEHQFKQI